MFDICLWLGELINDQRAHAIATGQKIGKACKSLKAKLEAKTLELQSFEEEKIAENEEDFNIEMMRESNARLVAENTHKDAELKKLKEQVREMSVQAEERERAVSLMKTDLKLSQNQAQTNRQGAEMANEDLLNKMDELR